MVCPLNKAKLIINNYERYNNCLVNNKQIIISVPNFAEKRTLVHKLSFGAIHFKGKLLAVNLQLFGQL